jgi:hypothetical protein
MGLQKMFWCFPLVSSQRSLLVSLKSIFRFSDLRLKTFGLRLCIILLLTRHQNASFKLRKKPLLPNRPKA